MKTSILRQLVILPLLIASMALLYACSSAFGRAGAEPPAVTRNIVLTQGASVALAATASSNHAAAQLRLERVNDSRCRAGTVCVWAGYISYSFVLTGQDGSTSQFVLSENMPNARASITEQGWTITLTGLEPQAAPAKDEIAPDYRVSLRVSNAPSS
ncbi:hypothetical protein [Duganella qianjiadongensis]|uniref:Uncharacterized protein n=1 Tax=Duganella qianjiadongensis TaxID=2692176 RepID=A0ABW9VHJ8_9BURK|nr:hypothetical protein [Duganella qianjiadongensis]MYM38975.1 hypothetical protein [Duganella qianjiadongensis]